MADRNILFDDNCTKEFKIVKKLKISEVMEGGLKAIDLEEENKLFKKAMMHLWYKLLEKNEDGEIYLLPEDDFVFVFYHDKDSKKMDEFVKEIKKKLSFK